MPIFQNTGAEDSLTFKLNLEKKTLNVLWIYTYARYSNQDSKSKYKVVNEFKDFLRVMNYNCETLKEDKLEDNKKMLYELDINLQDILIDIIKSYSQLDKLNFDSIALDDSEIIQHKKLLIAIVKKLDLIKKYSDELEKVINEYDNFDTITSKLNNEVAKTINDFLIDNLPAEDVVVEDDIYTSLKWIKNKNYDNPISKKFLDASET